MRPGAARHGARAVLLFAFNTNVFTSKNALLVSKITITGLEAATQGRHGAVESALGMARLLAEHTEPTVRRLWHTAMTRRQYIQQKPGIVESGVRMSVDNAINS